jgi:hypothetical protein
VQTGQDAQAVTLLCARAVVDAHLGRAEEARTAATRGLDQAARFGDGVGVRNARWALGRLALSTGDVEEAERVLGGLWRDSRAAGIVEPGENRYLGDLAEALVALGRLDEADQVAAEIEQRGTELDRPAVLAVAARCRGLVACARGDVDRALGELEDALARHEEVTLPFQQARTLLALGRAQRQAAQRRNARDTLEASRDSFAQLGAAAWERHAQDELARVGGRGPRTRWAHAVRATGGQPGCGGAYQPRGGGRAGGERAHRRDASDAHLPQARGALPHRARPSPTLLRRPRQRSWIPHDSGTAVPP